MELGLIVSGLFFGLITCTIAHQKGRGEVRWFLVGFLFQVFGLAVLFLPAVARAGITKKCLECAEIVRAEANVCRYCGRDLIAAEAVEEG